MSAYFPMKLNEKLHNQPFLHQFIIHNVQFLENSPTYQYINFQHSIHHTMLMLILNTAILINRKMQLSKICKSRLSSEFQQKLNSSYSCLQFQLQMKVWEFNGLYQEVKLYKTSHRYESYHKYSIRNKKCSIKEYRFRIKI